MSASARSVQASPVRGFHAAVASCAIALAVDSRSSNTRTAVRRMTGSRSVAQAAIIQTPRRPRGIATPSLASRVADRQQLLADGGGQPLAVAVARLQAAVGQQRVHAQARAVALQAQQVAVLPPAAALDELRAAAPGHVRLRERVAPGVAAPFQYQVGLDGVAVRARPYTLPFDLVAWLGRRCRGG